MKEITFGTKKFDAVICLFGKLPKKRCFKNFEDCPVLAADGAGIKLLKKGITPDYIIGDLDSFYSKPIAKKFDRLKIILIEDQKTNDFEKNLIFAKENGYQNIVILGLHGGELERSVNNWSVFLRYSKNMNLCIYDEYRYGIPIRESIKFNAEENEIISIIPQTRTKIITKNLKWALNNETLEFGTREGARNVAIDKNIVIELIDGEYLLFINSRLPQAPFLNEV